MKSVLRSRAIVGLVFLVTFGQYPLSEAASCEKPDRLRFSTIPRGDVKQEIAEIQPLLDKLQSVLGMPVEIYTPPSYGAVVEALQSGAVQLARLGPASYVSAKRADPQLTAFASYANRATPFQAVGPFIYRYSSSGRTAGSQTSLHCAANALRSSTPRALPVRSSRNAPSPSTLA